jgi:4-diphosphocytidyl-2-C-methyl-D-erythritol kinase
MPIPWCDVLEIVRSPDKKMRFTQTGLKVYGAGDSNLCVKAWKLLEADHAIGPVHIHLHKVIPVGAGLGGGSSDAAFTLLTLNRLFSLGLSPAALQESAVQLGSDCPFFIRNEPLLATGRGDKFRKADIRLQDFHLVVVKPKASVSTAEAYRRITPSRPLRPLAELLRLPPEAWKDQLKNDFEPSVFPLHVSIGRIKEKLYRLGAVYASMSGSGSAVFGLFRSAVNLRLHFRGSTVFQSGPGWQHG